ncbi:hypothetical protein Hanom_Chr05g00411691 [Helianthus anomalus]
MKEKKNQHLLDYLTMASLPIEPKDTLFLSDPKLNLRLDAPSSTGALLVEGKLKTIRSPELFVPKL